MTAAASVAFGAREPASTPAAANAKAGPGRRRHTPGGVRLGKDASREAQKLAAAILEVLAGARTPGQAAEALGMSLPRYFQVETRAMQALVAGCEVRPRGRAANADKELAVLRRQQERLQRELARQQTLVRLAQRTIGLAPPPAAPSKPPAGKKKRRRPVVRALHAAQQLQRQSQETPPTAPAADVKENML
jgi:hypothetical protein